MSVKWTEEQQQVIDLRDCNILVSAAAGSGKTAVLVERILSRLTDTVRPVDIDRLLIVTFTRAAAGEMRDRIRDGIEKKLETLTPGTPVYEHLQRQNAILPNAQISTIDSFCQYVVRNYFHTIQLDPGFRIMDDAEGKLLVHDVMEKLLEERFAQKDPAFIHMVDCIAHGRNEHALEELVERLYTFSTSFPWPEKWLTDCLETYRIDSVTDFVQQAWFGKVMEQTAAALQDAEELIEEALAVTMEPDGPWMYGEMMESDLTIIQHLKGLRDYASCSRVLCQPIAWKRLSVKKDESVSDLKKTRVKDLREICKGRIRDLQTSYFYAPVEMLMEQMTACAPVMEQLINLTLDFGRALSDKKRQKNLMDFSDLEHFALQILLTEEDGKLQRTPVAEEFAEHFVEIMTDEYQDSNLVQEMILTAISGVQEGRFNIFMVGDVKQSIYRFRQARPELFMEKYASYSLTEGKERRIDLHKNFRSRRQVLNFSNFIFEQIMGSSLGGVAYDEAAALHQGAVFAEKPDEDFCDTEVLLIDTETELDVNLSKREVEAYAIGCRIRKIVGKEQVWDKDLQAYRPAQYRDIVILQRAVTGWADTFAKTLIDMGIPAYTGSRTGYFDTIEVRTILSVLQLIDNPDQDIPIAAVLHSPIVGMTTQELAELRTVQKEMPFYRVCQTAEHPKLQRLFAMLSDLRTRASYQPMYELLWEVYEQTGYYHYAAAMPGGEQRKANLDMLVEKAIAYEKGSYRGLYHFIRYMDNLHKYDVDFGEAGIGGEENDTVRIMSIHKSKGLEFPIVFVAGMGKKMNRMDASGAVLMHADLGIGCDLTDPVLRIKNPVLLKQVIKEEVLLDSLGEEMRILYVALTRAKEKLILTGTASGPEPLFQKWSAVCGRKNTLLAYTQRRAAATYFDWVMPALLRHESAASFAKQFEIPINPLHPLYHRNISCRISLVTQDMLLEEEIEEQKEDLFTLQYLLNLPQGEVFDDKLAKKLLKQFHYQYPYAEAVVLPGKVSVSELKKMSYQETQEEAIQLVPAAAEMDDRDDRNRSMPETNRRIPAFLQEEETMSGANRGTVFHRFMECVDFAALIRDGYYASAEKADKAKIRSFLLAEKDRMILQGLLKEQEAQVLNFRKLTAFFLHPIARRMAKADIAGRLYREQRFVLQESAAKLRSEWPSEETVLIQGVIDAYFAEGGQLILLDYKTDRIDEEKGEDESSLFKKYKVQLECYETALNRLTDQQVSEKYLYSFARDRLIGDEFDE